MSSTTEEATMQPPKSAKDLLFALGGFEEDNLDVIETLNSQTGIWHKLDDTTLDLPRCYHGSVSVGNEIYIIGGFVTSLQSKSNWNRASTDSCIAINVATKTRRDLCPMGTKRGYVAVALLDGYIYAMGGFVDDVGIIRHDTAERYDIEEDEWSPIASMHCVRSDAGAAALDGKVYVVGGFNGNTILTSGEFYDPRVDQWTVISSMSRPRSSLCCVAHHGHVFAIGGSSRNVKLNAAEKYDPATDTWRSISPMHVTRSTAGVGILNDKIFVVGGFDGAVITPSVEYYDDATDQWHMANSMSRPRSAMSISVVSNPPNFSDYLGRPKFTRGKRSGVTENSPPEKRIKKEGSQDEKETEEGQKEEESGENREEPATRTEEKELEENVENHRDAWESDDEDFLDETQADDLN